MRSFGRKRAKKRGSIPSLHDTCSLPEDRRDASDHARRGEEPDHGGHREVEQGDGEGCAIHEVILSGRKVAQQRRRRNSAGTERERC